MKAIFDTNVLLRYANPSDPAHTTVVQAVQILPLVSIEPHLVPQNIYEFWVVGTRPTANNGLGLTTQECDQTLAHVEAAFPFLPDKANLFTEWRKLVIAHDCKGKVAHDARFVAAMRTYGITHIVTFNGADFARYPGIVVLDPNAIVADQPN